jgi:heme/copper-type cytochrome/quinol oxidase subunit 4
MNEPESPKAKPRRGRDFLIGFGASIAYALILIPVLLLAQSEAASVFSIAILFLASLEMLLRKRHYIALGIFAALIAVPLLMIGACFGTF